MGNQRIRSIPSPPVRITQESYHDPKNLPDQLARGLRRWFDAGLQHGGQASLPSGSLAYQQEAGRRQSAKRSADASVPSRPDSADGSRSIISFGPATHRADRRTN